jgi:uncharacterized protein DUF2442
MNKSSGTNTLSISEPLAVSSRVEDGALIVALDDGREVRTELARYPRLKSASRTQLSNWRLIGRGVGIHWPDLDEDLSIAGMLRDGVKTGPSVQKARVSAEALRRLNSMVATANTVTVSGGSLARFEMQYWLPRGERGSSAAVLKLKGPSQYAQTVARAETAGATGMYYADVTPMAVEIPLNRAAGE